MQLPRYESIRQTRRLSPYLALCASALGPLHFRFFVIDTGITRLGAYDCDSCDLPIDSIVELVHCFCEEEAGNSNLSLTATSARERECEAALESKEKRGNSHTD